MRGWSQSSICLLGCLIALPFSHAAMAASVDLGLRLEPKLVKFQASVVTDPQRQRIEQALREGSVATMTWNIDIESVRRYWLNKGAANVSITRRVVPDLVSRTWSLVDVSGGVERRVSDVDAAMVFLTHLDEFPIIDRSLLEAGQRYRLRLSLEVRLGRPPGNWFERWAGHWWGYEQIEAALDFTNN
ncbi:MAG: DUF4390 domain-containing protein [Mariprofundaceae bacterium]